MTEVNADMNFGDRELEGRVALVTGASRNIGRAIALALADGGASVVAAALRDQSGLDATIEAIRSRGGRAVGVLADLTKETDVESLIETARASFGRLDILVNNAAIRNEAPLEELTFAAWRGVLALALDAPFLCAKAALPSLRNSGCGAIVNIGGLTAYIGASHRAHVIAAKAGLDGLTKALAHELAPRGITVNLVSPGLVETHRSDGPQPHHHAKAANLVGRRGTPAEIAAMVRFLCGPSARYVTGQTIHVNGGAYLP